MVKLKQSANRFGTALQTQSNDANDKGGVITTRLLPMVFAAFDAGSSITVLDMGLGTSSTVNFLSDHCEFRSKLFFVDLYSHPLAGANPENPLSTKAPEPVDETEAAEQFTEALNLPADTLIDVVLFWDFLHYLDTSSLHGLDTALAPHLHSDTVAYCLGALPNDPNERNLVHSRYGIAAMDKLKRMPSDTPAPRFMHSQQKLADHLGSFFIGKATLLQEGRLEFLLQAD